MGGSYSTPHQQYSFLLSVTGRALIPSPVKVSTGLDWTGQIRLHVSVCGRDTFPFPLQTKELKYAEVTVRMRFPQSAFSS